MARLTTEALVNALRAHPRAKAPQLCASLDVDQSTLSRALKRLGSQVVSRGGSSRTRYALARAVRGGPSRFPLYELDRNGKGIHIGDLDCTYPEGTAVLWNKRLPWPADDMMRDGWYEGLPYWLEDIRPLGFLGRNFARQHARTLQVSEDPNAWSNDDVLYVLSVVGADQPGNIIIGDAAYELFLEQARTLESRLLADADLSEEYPRHANNAIAGSAGGSSAAGEFPKFTAVRRIGEHPQHVIVKFSGGGNSAAEQRLGDLLVAEHLALECLRDTAHVPAATSRVFQYAGRTFLEVDRFDRHGLTGRSEACTLSCISAALIGSGETRWPALVESLHAEGHADRSQANVVRHLWWFGRLIGNTDMHLGNITFRYGLTLAEAYDMLPMIYAPLRGGELPAAEFTVTPPTPREREVWQNAARTAVAFWRRCADDVRITEAYRRVCHTNGELVERAAS
jgi:hypothetical protein